MTILTACQRAAIKLTGSQPTILFSTTDQFALELRVLANEVGEAVMKAHDWRKLTLLQTETGDGSDTSFALPSDYDRMPIKGNVYSSLSQTPLTRAKDLDQWQEFTLSGMAGSPGAWIMLGGELQILPALETGVDATYYYVSNLLWSTEAGIAATKTEATADADVFTLPERLIALGVVWRWKQMKGKEYGEDLKNFEIAFGEEAGRDKGSRLLYVGPARVSSDAELAYPGTITP